MHYKEKQYMKLGVILLLTSLTLTACSNQTKALPSFPMELNVISLSDGGICLDAESARRLAEYKALVNSI